MVEERPATMYKISKAAEQTKKSTKIASPQITVHVFRSSPKEKVQNIWFSNLNFRISPTNGKYPISHFTQSTFFTLCKQNTATSNFNKVENWGKTYKALISYDYTVFSIFY